MIYASFESSEINPSWDESRRGRRITIDPGRFIRPDTRIFAIGSCFAVEIRKAMRLAGYRVFPDYATLDFDPALQSPAKLPERDNINHYDTYVIRQEIERAIDGRRWGPDDFWTLSRHPLIRRKGWPRVCKDPYRRDIHAADMDALAALSAGIGECIARGLEVADVAIITLGLTECWRNRANGRYVCMGPRSRDDEIWPLVDFHASSFAENYANLAATIDSIWNAFPDKKIVLTVSPVALGRTWTGEDVVVANSISKSTLRAVVGQICRERPSIVYWPSFEWSMTADVFREDGRHVRPDAVDRQVGGFLELHRADA